MKYIVVGILLFSIIGCTPEPLDLEVEQAESELVVSTQIIPDRGMIVAITRSFSALSDGTEGSFDEEDLSAYLVTNAKVTIDYNNRSVELIEINPGLYFTIDVIQEVGPTYTINIEDTENSKTAKASTQVLQPIAINGGSAILDYRETGRTNLNMTYNFNDPPGKNFYMFNVYINPKLPEPGTDGGIEGSIGGSKGGGPQSDFSGFGNLFSDYSETWLVTDDGFDGQNIRQEHTVFDIAISPDDTIFYTLSNISEDYYNFLNARERSRNTIPFVGEPTTLPTNLEGGYGFFSMHYPFPYFLSIED